MLNGHPKSGSRHMEHCFGDTRNRGIEFHDGRRGRAADHEVARQPIGHGVDNVGWLGLSGGRRPEFDRGWPDEFPWVDTARPLA
jgi:hypothetical protein